MMIYNISGISRQVTTLCYEALTEKLAWLSVEDYGATVMEIIVASAMKGYLRRMSEEEALKKVESIIEPKIIQLFGESGAPMPVQSHVDGAKFAAFIDEAVADSYENWK